MVRGSGIPNHSNTFGSISMTIYEILSAKPHNSHYLMRYYKFILYCKEKNVNTRHLESHHICPKAKDLFPEYSSFSKNKWNKIKLTPRQHYIAHWMLYKAYEAKSCAHAFWAMCHKGHDIKVNSKVFEELRIKKAILQKDIAKQVMIDNYENTNLRELNSNLMSIRNSDSIFRDHTSKSLSKRISGTKWYNDGTRCIRSKIHPGEGWILGRQRIGSPSGP